MRVGATVAGRIDRPGDADWFRVFLVAGRSYAFRTAVVGATDTELSLLGPDGTTVLDRNDDDRTALSPTQASRLPSDPAATGFRPLRSAVHYLRVRHSDRRAPDGRYTLRVLGVDTAPPALSIASPPPAHSTRARSILVRGRASDASGVDRVLVNGIPATLGPGGSFARLVRLRAGLNVITVEAADTRGNRVRARRAVLRGAFVPAGQPVPEAFSLRLERGAFAAAEALAARKLRAADFERELLRRNPVAQGKKGGGPFGAFSAQARVDVRSFSSGPVRVSLRPEAGGLRASVTVPRLDLSVRVSGKVSVTPFPPQTVRLTAGAFRVETLVRLSVPPGGGCVATRSTVAVRWDRFAFDLGWLPGFVEGWLRGLVQAKLSQAIEDKLEPIVAAEVRSLVAGATQRPLRATVLGRPASVRFTPRELRFDPGGATLVADGDVRIAPSASARSRRSPGSLSTPGSAPRGATPRHLRLAVDDDLLNRAAHAAWTAGLLDLRVDAAAARRLRFPAALQGLDVGTLRTFFPGLSGLDDRDPVEFRIEAALPPVVRAVGSVGRAEASFGALAVEVLAAPAGRPRRTLLRATVHATARLAFARAAGDRLSVRTTARPRLAVDVRTAAPGLLDPLAVENLLDFLLPPALERAIDAWSGIALPAPPGVRLLRPSLGRSGSHFTLEATLLPR